MEVPGVEGYNKLVISWKLSKAIRILQNVAFVQEHDEGAEDELRHVMGDVVSPQELLLYILPDVSI